MEGSNAQICLQGLLREAVVRMNYDSLVRVSRENNLELVSQMIDGVKSVPQNGSL